MVLLCVSLRKPFGLFFSFFKKRNLKVSIKGPKMGGGLVGEGGLVEQKRKEFI